MPPPDATAAEQQPLLAGPAAPTGASYFRRSLGAREAFALAISVVIGSGIFTSPGAVDTNAPSPGAALVVWLVGGLLAWTGAATLAELGTALPGEGGVQPYLQYVYGDVFGFLAAWTWLVAVMPSTLAILAIVFVESWGATAAAQADGGSGSGSADAATAGAGWLPKLFSLVVLAATTLANSAGTRATARLNVFFVVTKFATIAAVVAAAAAVVVLQLQRTGAGDVPGGHDWRTAPRNWFRARPTTDPTTGAVVDWPHMGAWAALGRMAAALYGALWAYSGWDKALYVTAELADPARQLPRALHSALPVIIGCFLAANASYYVLVPWRDVSTTDSIAVTAFAHLLGPGFGRAVAVLVCLVVAGALLGNSFVAGRMAVAAANKGWIPAPFAVLGRLGRGPTHGPAGNEADHAANDAPINALLLAACLATVYVLFGNFRALLTFNGLGEFVFFFLTVMGALVLRIREPDLPRPYKPWIAAPLAFAAVSSFVVVRGAVFAPTQALVLVALWLLGLAYYYGKVAIARRQQQDRDEGGAGHGH